MTALAGARVLVTGASSGIGAATAEMLATQGATVAAAARRADRLAEVVDRCRVSAPDSRSYSVDLGNLDAACELVERAWRDLGGLDAVVFNAAIPKRRPVQVLSTDELDETMRVNFTSPVRMTLAVLPRMLDRDAGTLVYVGSVGARVGIKAEAAYCASKFALAGWAESIAADLWSTGVRVRLVNPGPIATEIWDQPGNDPARYDGPLERPEVVAEAIADAIQGEGFERYAPDLAAIVEWKTAHVDEFLAGVANQ